MTLNRAIGVAALIGAFAVPGAAMAASTAVATTNVNLRAGPSTQYPAVNVVRSGDDVRVFGCLSNRSWCDVGYGGQRGWMSSNYLAYVNGGQRYTGSRVISTIGAPVISFSVGSYWGNHYRGKSFYRDRDRFDNRGERREVRQEKRDLQQQRGEVRDARQDLRQERRAGENVRDERQEVRQERGQLREERRELRDARQERRN